MPLDTVGNGVGGAQCLAPKGVPVSLNVLVPQSLLWSLPERVIKCGLDPAFPGEEAGRRLSLVQLTKL